MKIAIHGLGRMGMQIARKLAESGQHEVFAHNRSPEPIEEAAGYGAKPFPDASAIPNAFGNDKAVV
jgi:3-hydroxyisobutyrate dehydrogenase-like beta-hydroxyacid dehydrogenase